MKKASPESLFDQFNEVMAGSALRDEAERAVRSAAQGVLGKLDVVSREEFDAQSQVLERTRARVEELEQQLDELLKDMEASSKGS